MLRLLCALGATLILSGTALAQVTGSIDFEGLTAGERISTVASSEGIGPVSIDGANARFPGENVATIFDSANPTGGDVDLGTPNETFGGPGIGVGGEMGAPFENAVPLGKVLIVNENLTDDDMDGILDDVDDEGIFDVQITVDFRTITAPFTPDNVTVTSIGLLDVEAEFNESAILSFFDSADNLIGEIVVPSDLGDNGVVELAIDVSGVAYFVLDLAASGAITDINFEIDQDDEPGEIGDTVYCDENDNGVQDAGEPGIEGAEVTLTCAGPDGQLGTADDETQTQTTDSDGKYLFDLLPASLCMVSVDTTSVPADKVPGSCPLEFEVDLQPGESFLDADFCFISLGEIGDTVYCDLNNNGVQDPGEPGIEGAIVDLVCAGPDGMYGTADDVLDFQATDANGNYLFTGLAAGLCEVSVDTTSVPDGKVPGVCPITFMVDLGVGESFLDADFCFVDEPPTGDEGCTPGYWKNHLEAWTPTGYTPEQLIEDVFEASEMYQVAGSSLLDNLRNNGGGGSEGAARILLRAAVAAILNASNPNVGYPRTTEEIIADVNFVLMTGHRPTILGLASDLDDDNNLGCPIGLGGEVDSD